MKMNIDITEAKVYPIKDAKSKVKAFAHVILNEALRLGSLRVVEGENGLFVSYPSEKGKDGKYYSYYNPINRESRNLIQDIILENYEKAVEAAH